MNEIEKLMNRGWSAEGAQILLDRRNEDNYSRRWIAKLLGEPNPKKQYTQKKKDKIPSNLRWQIWERDNFTCQKCGRRNNLSVDHIHPESRGGKMEESNLQTLCRNCNSSKGTT